jgi:hypothetical protein
MGDQKPGFYLNICRTDAEFVSETGFFSLSRYCGVRRHQPCVIVIENLGTTHLTYLLYRSPFLTILLKNFALKKKDYLLTALDFLLYILDNGNIDKNNYFCQYSHY